MGFRAFLFPVAKKIMESKSLVHSQITTDQNRSENPRPTGRGGTTQVVDEGVLRTENARKFLNLSKPLIRPFGYQYKVHLVSSLTMKVCSK